MTSPHLATPGGGGVLSKCLYGEAPPRGPTPFSFIYHFSRKRHPFHIPSIDKGYHREYPPPPPGQHHNLYPSENFNPKKTGTTSTPVFAGEVDSKIATRMEPRSTDTHLMQTVTDSFVCPDEKVICFIQNQPGRFICSPVNTDNRHLPVTISLISSNLLGSCFIPKGRQGAVCKIKCCNCHATYIGGTSRNLST